MKTFKINTNIQPFVKEIILLENKQEEQINHLPFFADGYPGIMYSETKHGVILLPHNKLLSDFILYGQTVEPIQLQIKGAYKLLVFQLYPFATRPLLDIAPKEVTDKCYDLYEHKIPASASTIEQLQKANVQEQMAIISNYILDLVEHSSSNPDNIIKLAVSTIINTKGNITIAKLRDQLFITERTFERRFANEIGVTAKQFAKIVQFSFSLHQLKEADYTKLTNVAYDNGFTDQSHFIRSFKKYTGKTPKQLLLELN